MTLPEGCRRIGTLLPSEGGGNPCEVCSWLESVNLDLAKYRQMQDEIKKLMQVYKDLKGRHKTCIGCKLCFGGLHIAKMVVIEGVGEVCQWCAARIKKQGKDKFLAKGCPDA